jgi:hypothetical protein
MNGALRRTNNSASAAAASSISAGETKTLSSLSGGSTKVKGMLFVLVLVFLLVHFFKPSRNIYGQEESSTGLQRSSQAFRAARSAQNPSHKFSGMNAIVYPGDKWADSEPQHCLQRLEKFGDTG